MVLNCSYPLSQYLDFTVYDIVVALLLCGFVGLILLQLKKSSITYVSGAFVLLGALAIIMQRQFITPGCVADNINFFGLFMFNIYDFFVSAGIVGLVYDNYLRR